MIVEGFKLTLLGMGVVFAFLGLLVMSLHLLARLLKKFTEREASIYALQMRRRDDVLPSVAEADRQKIIAIVSAAVSAHRSSRNKTPQP